MGTIRRLCAWLVGAMIGLQAVAAIPLAAEDRFRFGTADLNLSGGYSISYDRTAVAGVDGYHILPHVGYFLSDERGPWWLRGNFELVVEPVVLNLRSDTAIATGAGAAILFRWVFASGLTVRPYLELGGGFLHGNLNFRQTNCHLNYVAEAGPGVMIFLSEATAVTVGARLQHISNGSRCGFNLGINSSLFLLGISHFFR